MPQVSPRSARRGRPVALALLVSLLAPHARASEPPADPPAGVSAPLGAEAPEFVPAVAVEPEEEDGRTLVTASLLEDPTYTSAIVTRREMRRTGTRTVPQALRTVPGVLVQETAFGQGSPFIRGFTGYRNLFLIDGIRLNNSVFRSGPNQYWNTVDAMSLDRLEIYKGPRSIRFGSDAVGGTINAVTKLPYAYGRPGGLAGELFYRYSSAEASHSGRAEVSGALGDSTGILVGVGGRDFGDLRSGEPTGRQPGTGYLERNADLKLEHFLGDEARLVLGFQALEQDDVPRTHRTVFAVPFMGTTVGSDLQRTLDQDRVLAYAQLRGEVRDGAIDDYALSLSWHGQDEERYRVRGSGAVETQGFDVETVGFFAHLGKETELGRFTFGADVYRDDVDSFSSTNAVQGPVADEASYDLVGLFVEDEIPVGERSNVALGARFQYAGLDADRVLDPVTSNPTAARESWQSFLGSARFTHDLDRAPVQVYGGVSQGFRAPNLSDMTRFDSARTNEFEIPALDLSPEKYLTFELGARSETERQAAEVALFYTDVEDQISIFPTGNTNAFGEAEVTKANIGDGYVYGAELQGEVRVAREWSAFGSATLMTGRVDAFPTSAQMEQREYIDRVMPFTFRAGTRWESADGRLWAELVGIHADDGDRLSTRDRNDTSRIPPGGTPNYTVFHVRGGVRVREGVTLDLALENVTDEDYRVHGSGTNMPGRGVVASLTIAL